MPDLFSDQARTRADASCTPICPTITSLSILPSSHKYIMSDEVEHTPAPWDACDDGECECGLIWSRNQGILVAKACGPFEQKMPTPSEPARTANHKLIAAAPHLLTASKMGLKMAKKAKRLEERHEPRGCGSAWPDTLDSLESIRGVIAKAEGRP